MASHLEACVRLSCATGAGLFYQSAVAGAADVE